MGKKAFNIIKIALSFILAAVLVYFAFRGVDWEAFIEGLKGTRWGYVALFFAASVGALIFREERWRIMIRPLDPEVRRIDAWDSANVGNLTNVVLPGAGEFVRCGYISSKRMSYDKALGTIMCERAWDVVAILSLLVLALVMKWGTFGSFFMEQIWHPLSDRLDFSIGWILAAAVLLVAAFIWSVFRFRRRSAFCEKLASGISGLGTGFASFAHIRNKWAFILSTIGIWVMYLLMTYFMFKAVPALSHLSMVDAIFISSVGNIASVIPVPGGIGAYHYLVAISLQTIYGAPWETGILFATLSHELHALLIIILGAVSYFALTLRKNEGKL